MFGSTQNAILFGVTAVCSIFHFFSLRKEFPYRRSTSVTAILPLILTIAMYILLLNTTPMSPLFIYLLLSGLIMGLLLGVWTKIYPKGNGLYGKRSRFYLLLWTVTVILTQGTLQLLGTAAAGIGTTLMFFSLGMAISQQSVLSVKAGTARRKSAATVLGLLVFAGVLLMPGGMLAARNPFHHTRHAAYAYYWLAKDAYAQGNFAAAIDYGRRVVSSTRSPGTQAKGYMVIFLAGGGAHYGDLAHQGVLNSAQIKRMGLSGPEREETAFLFGLGIMQSIEDWQYQGFVLDPNENIIAVPGVFAVANSQLIGLWEELKSAVIERLPILGGVIGVLDALVNEMAQSRPVSEGAAATSAAVASSIMLVTGLLNILITKPDMLLTAQPQSVPTQPPAEQEGIALPAGSPYVEGHLYTFHDGVEYKVRHGKLVPMRKLAEGEVFTDPNGDKRVWVGNQAWIEKDWIEQQAITRAYADAHQRDWVKASTEPSPQQALNKIKEYHQAEMAATQREIDERAVLRSVLTPEQLEVLRNRMGQVIRDKINEGYFVRNPNVFAKLWHNTLGRIPELARGWKGGQCGEFGEWGVGWSKDFIRETVGEGAIVETITMDRNRFTNHRGTIVIMPNGERYIFDYWESISSKEPKIYTEQEWVNKWRKQLGGNAKVIIRSRGEMDLHRAIQMFGEEKGIEWFRNRPENKAIAETTIRSWRRAPWQVSTP